MTRWLALCALLAGCSLYGRADEPGDGGWPGDDLPACETTRQAYRIDAITIPESSSAGEDLGWDFDDDMTMDNQAGNIISAVSQATGLELMGAVQEALDADVVQIGFTIDTCAAPAYALVSVARGIELDRGFDPPRMLGDSASSLASVAIGAPPTPATDGVAQFPVAQLLHRSVTDWIDAVELVVDVEAADATQSAGRMMACLDGTQAYDTVTDAFQRKMVERIDELGADDPVTQDILGLFDENEDGMITLDEVRDSYLVMTLLRPDVDSDGDGVEDCLSIGVGFHAEPVELYLRD